MTIVHKHVRKLTDLVNILHTDTEFCISASLILFMLNSHIYVAIYFLLWSSYFNWGIFACLLYAMLHDFVNKVRLKLSYVKLQYHVFVFSRGWKMCFSGVFCCFLFVGFFFLYLVKCISVTLSSVENCN